MDDEIKSVFSLFFDEVPVSVRTIDTSRGGADYRMTFLVETDTGSRRVLKLADNDFTFPEKIAVWQRTVEEYRRLGCYCPQIFRDKSGHFPVVCFHGHNCAAYAENIRHSGLSTTGSPMTSAGIVNCMTAICRTSGG